MNLLSVVKITINLFVPDLSEKDKSMEDMTLDKINATVSPGASLRGMDLLLRKRK